MLKCKPKHNEGPVSIEKAFTYTVCRPIADGVDKTSSSNRAPWADILHAKGLSRLNRELFVNASISFELKQFVL